MMAGTAQHEIGGGLTDLGAVHHEAEMGGFDMLAACFQAMVHGLLQAHTVAAVAGLDTRLHILTGGSKHEHNGVSFVGLLFNRKFAKANGKT
jgi:hypothetical protein